MHEAARHAIHTTETLTVSIATVTQLLEALTSLSPSSHPSKPPTSLFSSHITLHSQTLRNLVLRAHATKERLQNEVAQAHNMIAQRDSEVMRGLGEAAKRDSGAMRSIAVVTMAFLPGTFLSVSWKSFFSLSLFASKWC